MGGGGGGGGKEARAGSGRRGAGRTCMSWSVEWLEHACGGKGRRGGRGGGGGAVAPDCARAGAGLNTVVMRPPPWPLDALLACGVAGPSSSVRRQIGCVEGVVQRPNPSSQRPSRLTQAPPLHSHTLHSVASTHAHTIAYTGAPPHSARTARLHPPCTHCRRSVARLCAPAYGGAGRVLPPGPSDPTPARQSWPMAIALVAVTASSTARKIGRAHV